MAKEHISELSFRKKLEFYLAVWLGWILIMILGHSYKIKIEGLEKLTALRRNRQSFLIAIWHGRFFMAVYLFRFWRLVALVSQHLDGEMIARNLNRLGFETVRGSSTRGGKKAFHEMVKKLSNGKDGIIIPDGPNGPRHQLKSGVIYMAQQANIPIIPFTFSAVPAVVFKSWDRYMLPKPFAKVLVKIGDPIWVSTNTSNRELVSVKHHVQSTMIKQEQAADEFFSP